MGGAFYINGDEGNRQKKGSHQFENWWQQLSTGQLHLDRFDSPITNKKRHLKG